MWLSPLAAAHLRTLRTSFVSGRILGVAARAGEAYLERETGGEGTPRPTSWECEASGVRREVARA